MRPPETITPPRSHADYNAVLRRSLGSKLFFMDKVPLSEMGVVVDFGCGDASLLRVAANAVPEDCLMVGVDSDPKQLAMARKNYVGIDETFTDMESVRFYLGDHRPTLLILSSVVHEVLSPGTTWSPEGFWRWVASFGFNYIAFRDMQPGGSEMEHYQLVTAYADSANRKRGLEKSFGDRWADTSSFVTLLLHYLLKEPYAEDWERENAEDYWAGTRLDPCIPLLDQCYLASHYERTITPFFRERVRRVHGFDIPSGITTHLELVLKKWTSSSPS